MEISTLTVYHCLVFVWYFFVVYAIAHVRTEERPSEVFLYGGQWKYLTVLNLVLQAVFHGVSFLADVLRLIKKLRCAKCVISSRDLLFSVLAFPVSTFVSISFWILYTYNRELVYPKSLDGVIPLWLNHAMHTAVLPIAVLEILVTPHRYPAKKKGLILLGCVFLLYISWVLWIYYVTGEWVYPLFALFNPAGLVAFFAGSLGVIITFYNFGEFLNRMIWGDAIVILDYRQKGK
ncbi:Adtrp [Columba livia]|uniref:Androgen-dependent TFPI-regulating protein n=1 Tax=Columba livia TaxID=8932 RepID=A0A2I0MXL7_COLLI|nr:androgen-dependent TFPI-regulating protein isoform X1 [Columba livia]KAK2530475.1 Adtrp [Columba livia]PKK34427.1 androgen-dependent TFPI-regulating protein [Columba livia]